jgi:hypothetical protein
MADKKISALTASSTPLAGTEVLPIVQSGATVKVAVSDLTAGRAVATAGLTNTGSANLGASATNVTAGGYTTKVSGMSITTDGTTWLGSYGGAILNSDSQYSSGARRWALFSGVNITNFGIARSTSATTDPVLGGNGGTMSSGTLDFEIDTSGNVKILTGSMGIASGIAIGNATPPGAVFAIGGSVLSSGAGTHFLKWSNVSGNVTYDTSSRLVKTEIEDSSYGLAEILKLRPRKYFRTDDQKYEHGLIADEVVDIMPEYVPMVPKSLLTKNDADTEIVPGGVNYERIVAPLINAIHELNAQVEMLKSKLGA